jgi:dipeptidyl-peptidase 4
MVGTESYPRQFARTRRFSCGEPKSYRFSADGSRVVFLRSLGGDDPVNRLWCLDRLADGTWSERLVVDPLNLELRADGSLPAAELARRERMREQASGITSYDVDADASLATFALNGTLVVADLDSGQITTLATKPGGYDPRLSPDGTHVAYVSDRCLRIVSTQSGSADDRLVAGEDDEAISWGVVDFVAAEELNRYRGFWWSPDSTHLLAERVDVSMVNTWTIANPTSPAEPPVSHRYPAAGTNNAVLSLAIFAVGDTATTDSMRTDVSWSHQDFPYLVDAQWTGEGILLTLLNRRHRHLRVVDVSSNSGVLTMLHEVHDETWVDVETGSVIRLPDGDLLVALDTHVVGPTAAGLPTPAETDTYDDPEGSRALVVITPHKPGHRFLTPPNLQVRQVIGLTHDGDRVLIAANASRPIAGLDIPEGPATISVLSINLTDGSIVVLAGASDDPGIHSLSGSDQTYVLRSTSMDRALSHHQLIAIDASASAAASTVEIANLAEVAVTNPRPTFFRAGPRAIPCCIFFPTDLPDDPLAKLPVLMDPYGGPHAARVVASRNAHVSSQWLADQGFIVLVADGRGTPGIGPVWEREVYGDLAGPVLDDQITALHEAAARYPQMDLGRVGIRGWSFGGYLAALAVLREPDVFHAAVAGAPVTDWRLYDTGYTERYLGHPDENPEAYERSSLFPLAAGLRRPLLLIHGLADDNVVAAHTLQLSSRLLAAGRSHSVLPLSGVTHMTPQEEVAENLLLLQVEFLHDALGNVKA